MSTSPRNGSERVSATRIRSITSPCLISAVATAATLTLIGALSPAAALAAPAPAEVAIISPEAADAATDDTVPISLRGGAKVRRISAFVDTRNVSSRFHRHGNRWTANLPRKIIGTGSHRLLVQGMTQRGGGGTDAVTFVVGRQNQRLLTGITTADRKDGEVRISARSRTGTTATFKINGQEVTHLDGRSRVAHHHWRINARDGLRRGRNRVVVTLLDRRGNVATKRWTFNHARSEQLGATNAPAFGEQGMYLGTDLEQTGGFGDFNTIYIDGTPYTSSIGAGAAAIFVQLDSKTLAPVGSSLDGTPLQPRSGVVTIAVWEDTTVPFSAATSGSRIWIDTSPVAVSESLNGSGAGNPNTNLHGWLRPAAGTQGVTWTDSDILKAQTRGLNDAATTNTMRVDGQSYPVSLASSATGGFELLTLGNAGAPTSAPTSYPFTGEAAADQVQENRLAQDLQSAVPQHVTIMLQGFGTLPAIDPTGSLAQAIGAIGGNADVISRFGPNQAPDANGGAYALIAARHATFDTPPCALSNDCFEWVADETSSERTGSGTLQAQLVRDATQNNYVPITSDSGTPDPVSGGQYEFLPLVYQAPSSWASWVPDGKGSLRAASSAEQAAFKDIQAAMTAAKWISGSTCTNAPDTVRGALCNADANALTNIALDVETLEFDADQGSAGGYTSTDFKTAQGAVVQEFTAASTIRGAIDQYQKVFAVTATGGGFDAATIGTNLQKVLRKSSSSTAENLESFLSSMTGMLSVLNDVAPEMTFASGAFGFMSGFTPASGPGNDLADDIQVTQASAGANLVNALQKASNTLERYGDYLAADPVKLMQGAELLNSDDYAVDGDNFANVQDGALYAANQYLWGTLMSVAYSVWTGPATLGPNPTCTANGVPATNESDPFSNTDANGRWSSVQGSTPTLWYVGQSVAPDDVGNTGVIGLPGSTSDQLTGAIDPSNPPSQTSNAGAVMPYFANRYLTQRALPLNPNPSRPDDGDGCMPHLW